MTDFDSVFDFVLVCFTINNVCTIFHATHRIDFHMMWRVDNIENMRRNMLMLLCSTDIAVNLTGMVVIEILHYIYIQIITFCIYMKVAKLYTYLKEYSTISFI